MSDRLKKAVARAKILRPGYKIGGCLDFGDYWAFSCQPTDSTEVEYDGICCIDKKTLNEKFINPMCDPAVFITGVLVSI